MLISIIKVVLVILMVLISWLLVKNFNEYDTKIHKIFAVVASLYFFSMLICLYFLKIDTGTRFLIHEIFLSFTPILMITEALIILFYGYIPIKSGNIYRQKKPFVFWGIIALIFFASIITIIYFWDFYGFVIWKISEFFKFLY